VADLSPAADAGISAGDVIQSVAGQAVSNRDEFRQASEAVKDRSSFEVVLLRRKQTLAVTLQPGLDGPSSMPTPATAPADAVEAK
jgi:S1-C subfamily serine protease